MNQIAAPVSPATQDAGEFINQIATRAAGLGREMAAIFGALDDVTKVSTRQGETFSKLEHDIAEFARSNGAIDSDARNAEQVAQKARDAVEGALAGTRGLAQAVERVETGLDAVMKVLKQVSTAAAEIEQIAFQTRIVAFNASVEAVRAGERGRGFAVVAEAVKELAQKVQDSSQQIKSTVIELGTRIDQLATDADAGTGRNAAAEAVDRAIDTFRTAFGEVEQTIKGIAGSAGANTAVGEAARAAVVELSGELKEANHSVKVASSRAESLLALSEAMVELTAQSGIVTEDTPFIERVIEVADRIGALFEDALMRGDLTLEQMFDDHYRPVPGSNPQQFVTDFTELTDRLLPPLQEPMLTLSDKVVFCAAVDRNGYLPTHNRKFSRPQGRDPAWNMANSRNRRMFNDRTGLAAGGNQQRFLLQMYRREMGNGNFVLMKDLSAPIWVRGRHWGGLRFAYSF
ncbi:MAG: hypothetical protein KF778_11030 [Rhodocyclaceae bacterium]|nr:hypothetical protein [Rhodocyclaceae bacterium]MBX3668927.1 hypothetical protein [Rhodocyclaceae bacterium]